MGGNHNEHHCELARLGHSHDAPRTHARTHPTHVSQPLSHSHTLSCTGSSSSASSTGTSADPRPLEDGPVVLGCRHWCHEDGGGAGWEGGREKNGRMCCQVKMWTYIHGRVDGRMGRRNGMSGGTVHPLHWKGLRTGAESQPTYHKQASRQGLCR